MTPIFVVTMEDIFGLTLLALIVIIGIPTYILYEFKKAKNKYYKEKK